MPCEPVRLEVCVESAAGARAAQEGGAERVELCANLLQGGVTPSAGAIALAREALSIELVVLVRPRPGDFLYDSGELAVCLADVAHARAAGAHAVALGVLTRDGRIDRERTRELVRAARPLKVAFHRAFDATRDQDEALDALLELEVDRVLTSGGAGSASEGVRGLARLVERAGGALDVVVAGGVRAHNALYLARESGARDLHFRADAERTSGMLHANARLRLGSAGSPPDDRHAETDPELVRAVRRALAGAGSK